MKTTPEAPILVSFATVNDGLVLRWYADEAAYADGDELASASRNRAWFRGEAVGQDLSAAVHEVHRRLRDVVYGGPLGHADRDKYEAVRALATHRSKHLFGDELVPVHDYRQEPDHGDR